MQTGSSEGTDSDAQYVIGSGSLGVNAFLGAKTERGHGPFFNCFSLP